MIIKQRETTLIIEKLQALLRRLPTNHTMFAEVESELSRRLAGMTGENSLDYPLSFLHAEEYHLFHGLRLFHDPYFFQIDTLIVTRKFLLVSEVKTFSGSLYFDQNAQQLVRTRKDGTIDIFSDPIIQVKRQKSLLEAWLVRNHLQRIPVIPYVVLSNPLTSISSNLEPSVLSQIVIHRDALPDRISHLSKTFNDECSPTTLVKLTETLQLKHTPLDPVILSRFKLTTSDLKKGVLCPSCSYSPVTRIYGSWHCPKCSTKSKDAHVAALRDYALLVETHITNREARAYLKLESESLTKRILNKIGGRTEGATKGRIYDLSHFRREGEVR